MVNHKNKNKIQSQKVIQQRLRAMEFQEPAMGKGPWPGFILHLVLQWILLEIFMLEITVQSE